MSKSPKMIECRIFGVGSGIGSRSFGATALGDCPGDLNVEVWGSGLDMRHRYIYSVDLWMLHTEHNKDINA